MSVTEKQLQEVLTGFEFPEHRYFRVYMETDISITHTCFM